MHGFAWPDQFMRLALIDFLIICTAVTHPMESDVDSFTVESVIRGYVPHLRGGVVKCNRRSAGLSP